MFNILRNFTRQQWLLSILCVLSTYFISCSPPPIQQTAMLGQCYATEGGYIDCRNPILEGGQSAIQATIGLGLGVIAGEAILNRTRQQEWCCQGDIRFPDGGMLPIEKQCHYDHGQAYQMGINVCNTKSIINTLQGGYAQRTTCYLFCYQQ